MTTLKQKKADEANAWLAVSDPRTGVKPWAQRKQFHEINALENAHIANPRPEPIKFTDFAKQAELDHAAVFQVGTVRQKAIEAGGSVNRYNARNQLHTSLLCLPEATLRRHSRQGYIAYQRAHANIKQFAKALADLGGETVALPPMLKSDAAEVYGL